MRILVSGSSGLVGLQLVKFLHEQGHEVVTLVRSFSKIDKDSIYWDPDSGELKAEEIEGFDAVINLSGDNIASGRWSARKKSAILRSRVRSTQLLKETILKLTNKPKVWINASAVGYYGDQGDTLVDENSPRGEGFLADVCQKWEEASQLDSQSSVRVVNLRIGVVLSVEGGALSKMLTPFKYGLGGVMGSGKQFLSWIHISDLVRMIDFILSHATLIGPVNGVAPHPVDNRSFTKILGEVLDKPTFLPMPAFAVKLIFGEMGKELLLSGCRVSSKKIQNVGFQFLYPYLKEALENLICKSSNVK